MVASKDENIDNILFIHDKPILWIMYYKSGWQRIVFFVLLHLNPLNLVPKYFILNFGLFIQIAIEVQKYLNTRIYEFNPPNTDKNYHLRYYSYITNTTETNKDVLREMFVSTDKEKKRNQMHNDRARKYHEA